ncbi:MAG: arylsulfatase [Armatimonadetes bacterium]|nr:arylsulfatase [Armatimonadota bacterium]
MPVADQRPNIILITTDQQRGDSLSCDGNPCCETPFLDDLASQGARFPHAYTSVPSCIPARTGLYTGMAPWNHGQLGMVGLTDREYPHTMAGELTAAGYQTRAVGKLHVYPQRKQWGFQHVLLDESSRRESATFISDYHQWFEEHKDGPYGYRDHAIDWNSWMARPSHLPEHLHPTSWTSLEGRRFLSNRDETKPFFLYLSFARPHSPYDPPQPYFDQYDRRDDISLPVVGDWAGIYEGGARRDDPNAWRADRSLAERRRARVGYYGSVTHIDHQIGLFLYELSALGLLDNSLIVFTSDHGDMVGDHHLWRKTYAYEGSARVPFIVRPPRSLGLEPGQVIDQTVELRDVMPTLLEAAGVEIPGTVDGASVLPLLRGETAGWRDYIHGEHCTCYSPMQENHYVTDGHEKLIWLPRLDRVQFFNLDEDPLEEHDRAADPAYAERCERWRQRLIAELLPREDGLTDGERLLPPTGPPRQFSPNHEQYVVGRRYEWKPRHKA